MIYKPDKFELYELLPKDFYLNNLYKGDNLWFIFDNRLLETLDILRKTYGKMYINTWKWGGKRQDSGYRPPDCKIGARLSQHRFGRATDILFEDYETEEVRQDIIERNKFFPYIKGIETGVSWLHIDTRNSDKLILFKKR